MAARRGGVLLRPHGRPGRGAAGRAGVPPPRLAPPRRRPDRHRRPRRGPRPLRWMRLAAARSASTTTTGSRLRRRPLADRHRQRRHGAPRQRLDRGAGRETGALIRCSPRTTTCSATPGSTATGGCTCTPQTARPAGDSPSPIPHARPRALARAGRRGPRFGAEAVRRLEPAAGTDGEPLLVLARAGTPQPSWRCTPRRDGAHRAAARHRIAHRAFRRRPRHAGAAGTPLDRLDRPRHPATGAPVRPRHRRDHPRGRRPGRGHRAAGAHRAADVHLRRRHHRPDVRGRAGHRGRARARPSSTATAASASTPTPPTAPPPWRG